MDFNVANPLSQLQNTLLFLRFCGKRNPRKNPGGVRMLTPWFGEFMGTLVLILLGDGVVAAVLLKKSKAENSGWMVITTGWALAVMCGVFTAVACGSPGANLNPAVTLGIAVVTGNFSRFFVLIA